MSWGKKLLDGLNIIDTSHFTGSQKLWFLQHLLIPCIQCPILIYEVPISLAFKVEQKGSVHIQKWLKLYKSITSLSFYSSASPCPLTVRSLTSVLKSSKISGQNLLSSYCGLNYSGLILLFRISLMISASHLVILQVSYMLHKTVTNKWSVAKMRKRKLF